MLRREVDWKNEGRVEAGPEVRVVAGVGRPDEFVPRPKTEVEPIPEMAPGRWRAGLKPISRWVYISYVANVFLLAILGVASIAIPGVIFLALQVRKARQVKDPDEPVLLWIEEIVEGGAPVSVGRDTGVAFVDGNALAWKGDRCSFRVGGQDVRGDRATFEMSSRPIPDETIDVDAHGRRLRLTFNYGKRRYERWREIATWAKRRPIERGPREAPPHQAGHQLGDTDFVLFPLLLIAPAQAAIFHTKGVDFALVMSTIFAPIGLLALYALDRRLRKGYEKFGRESDTTGTAE